ncbi:MAG: hypothetical protein AB7S38_06135 [Vulcanimicrobiota bacterium]
MTIEAMLCDYATVREGLLHVLGGGINRLWREKFPAQMGVTLAILLEIHPTEANRQHTMNIVLLDEDGRRLAEVNADFQVGRKATSGRAGENIIMPLAVSLQQMSIPTAGAYSVEILMDGQHKRSLCVLAANPTKDDRRQRGRTGSQN